MLELMPTYTLVLNKETQESGPRSSSLTHQKMTSSVVILITSRLTSALEQWMLIVSAFATTTLAKSQAGSYQW